MKLTTKITKPLDEGYHEVKIANFYHVNHETHPDGYYVLEFDVVEQESGNPRKLIVFPQQLEWHLSEFTGLAGLEEIEDTDELIGKKIQLYFSHSYTMKDSKGNQKVVQRKQWQLYRGN